MHTPKPCGEPEQVEPTVLKVKRREEGCEFWEGEALLSTQSVRRLEALSHASSRRGSVSQGSSRRSSIHEARWAQGSRQLQLLHSRLEAQDGASSHSCGSSRCPSFAETPVSSRHSSPSKSRGLSRRSSFVESRRGLVPSLQRSASSESPVSSNRKWDFTSNTLVTKALMRDSLHELRQPAPLAISGDDLSRSSVDKNQGERDRATRACAKTWRTVEYNINTGEYKGAPHGSASTEPCLDLVHEWFGWLCPEAAWNGIIEVEIDLPIDTVLLVLPVRCPKDNNTAAACCIEPCWRKFSITAVLRHKIKRQRLTHFRCTVHGGDSTFTVLSSAYVHTHAYTQALRMPIHMSIHRC